MYIEAVIPQSPAANAGLRPGDVIEAVDAVPVFINGKLTVGAIDLLHPRPSEQDATTITVHRPATDATWTVELRPTAPLPPPDATATVTLLSGDIAYAVFPTFQEPGAVDQILAEIAELKAGTTHRGVIVDVRANGGGRAEAVAKLLGAFVHGKAWGYNCDGNDHCTPSYTDDSVALLNLPLVVLTDGRCASACDAFSAGVKDLRLGTLVGARTAGVVAGLPSRYRLDDDRFLELTGKYALAANGEIINNIGVAVDHQKPMTAADLSHGRDPALDTALSLLKK
jgi:carboxyl-terminal processing protease